MQPDWPLGTHLTTPRRGYVHHGIYAGDGRVIHYAGYHRAFRRGPVQETTLEHFVHWCLWGAARSPQVERWSRPLRPLRAAIAALRAPLRAGALRAA